MQIQHDAEFAARTGNETVPSVAYSGLITCFSTFLTSNLFVCVYRCVSFLFHNPNFSLPLMT